MTDLVTLSEAKQHLRVLSDNEDAMIALYITAASDAVADMASGWDGEGDVPPRLKLAVLNRVAIMFDNRDSADAGKGEDRLILPLRELEL